MLYWVDLPYVNNYMHVAIIFYVIMVFSFYPNNKNTNRQTPTKPLPSLMAFSPMLCTHIDVEIYSGLAEQPLATTEVQSAISLKTILCRATMPTALHASTPVSQNILMLSTTLVLMTTFPLTPHQQLSHVG